MAAPRRGGGDSKDYYAILGCARTRYALCAAQNKRRTHFLFLVAP
jgi:hypothetical protein